MARASDNHDVVTFKCTFKHRTEKAVLIVLELKPGEEEEAWVPESAIVSMVHPQGFAGQGEIEIEKWLAYKRGWI